MDLASLNKLIVEHLRYYGFQVAARIVETEIKGNKSRIVEKPSKLFEIATKGSQSFEIPIHREENSSSSTNTRESSIKSGYKIFNGAKSDNVTITSEDIFPNNPNEIKRSTQFNANLYTTPDKLIAAQKNLITHGNTDGKRKEQSEVKDFRKTLGEKYPIAEDLAFKPAGGKPRPNDLSSIAKALDQYTYVNPSQALMNQTRTRPFDSQSDKQREAVRFPLLEAIRTNSMDAPQNIKPIQGRNANSYFQDSENGDEEDESRKVRDPSDLNKFIPYSFNGINQAKVTPNNPRGQRSISVPQRKEQFHEQDAPGFMPNGINYNNRNIQPQPPKENMNARATSVLKPIPNLNKSFLGKKMASEEDNDDSVDMHSKTVDYSILGREPDLSPLSSEFNARGGPPQRSIVRPPEYNNMNERFSTNQADPRASTSFKPNALITPKKVTKPPFEGIVKEANEPEYVPFRKPEESFHSKNTANPLIKNTIPEGMRQQPKIYDRTNQNREMQSKREERTHSMPPLENEYRSQVAFKPPSNTDDRVGGFGRSEQQPQEMFAAKANRNEFLKEFSYPSNRQAESTQNNKNQEEENYYMVSDSFGPVNWEKAKQNARNQTQSPAFLQNDANYTQGQSHKTDGNFINKQPSQRLIADRDNSFDPFSHTFYPEKNWLPNSNENIDTYNQKVELNHKTLEYLKTTTKCNSITLFYPTYNNLQRKIVTEKEIQEGFEMYIQVLNPKRNPELLMNRDKFVEYMRKMRGIGSPSFSETCFNFAVSALSNDRNADHITYREVGHLLDLIHPGHPFSFMKFLFKLYQGDEKRVPLKELEAPLRGISSGQLYEVALLLRSSLDYIYEKQKDSDVKFFKVYQNLNHTRRD